MPRVTRIEATMDLMTHLPIQVVKKRKVCGYARVSTGSEEQATSYEAQKDYYTKFIQARPEWEFVDIYADEGITGTRTKRIRGFNDMVADALNGKIDLILAKSISRFARNTVDTITTIRKLKENGVEVYFEKENIWTFDGKGEVLLTIMASLAQEESRSISENVTWGHRKRFEDGKYSVAYKQFLGYDRGENGEFIINPEQAKTVRFIYRRFLEGATAGQICKELMDHGILSPAGKPKWQPSTILSILTNEKYKGAALLQKTYTVDFLTKEHRKNNGELPKYYIEDAHDHIINPADWDVVQAEVAARKKVGSSISAQSFMSCKLICEDCGGYYGAKVWHSNSPYRKVIYRCNRKYDGEDKCNTPHFTEAEIQERFLRAYNTYMGDRDRIISDALMMVETLSDTSKLEGQLQKRKGDLDEAAELYRMLVTQDSAATGTPAFKKQEVRLYENYTRINDEVNELSDQLTEKRNRRHRLLKYIESLHDRPLALETWDSSMWVIMIDHCVVHKDKTVTFVFRDGTEITE